MDKHLSKSAAQSSSVKRNLKLAITIKVMKLFLSKNASNLIMLRRISDTATPLPLGVNLEKVYIKRKEILVEGFSDLDYSGLVKAEWIYPKSLNSPKFEERIILYLHGGGYFICSRKSHRMMTGALAKTTGAKLLIPEYRRAPESPFPNPLVDALSCYLNLINPNDGSKKFRPDQIFFAGDSAGGGLAISAMLWLRDNPQYPMPAGVIGLSPWLDMSMSHPSFILNRPFDYLGGMAGDENTVRTNKWLNSERTHYYCTHNDQITNPYVSPIFTDSSKNLPPILIQAGTTELLRDENIAFFCKTLEDKSDIKLELYEDMPHVFQMFLIKHFMDNICSITRSAVEFKKVKVNNKIQIQSYIAENPYKIVEDGLVVIKELKTSTEFDFKKLEEILPKCAKPLHLEIENEPSELFLEVDEGLDEDYKPSSKPILTDKEIFEDPDGMKNKNDIGDYPETIISYSTPGFKEVFNEVLQGENQNDKENLQLK
ncbi:hypothetical protein HDU92_001231 [Lobulomyces angularis]|nr:hypothetical protein HDU92_001231 [Lobulomyces angularis]